MCLSGNYPNQNSIIKLNCNFCLFTNINIVSGLLEIDEDEFGLLFNFILALGKYNERFHESVATGQQIIGVFFIFGNFIFNDSQ